MNEFKTSFDVRCKNRLTLNSKPKTLPSHETAMFELKEIFSNYFSFCALSLSLLLNKMYIHEYYKNSNFYSQNQKIGKKMLKKIVLLSLFILLLSSCSSSFFMTGGT